jgi:t-SNARE complex subunit (syntaxin)
LNPFLFADDVDQLKARNEALKHMTQDLQELLGMFRELQDLVNKHQPMVDTIVANLSNVPEYARQAEQELAEVSFSLLCVAIERRTLSTVCCACVGFGWWIGLWGYV